MPWIKRDMCTGCGACIYICPVDAIAMDEDTAYIDEERCIRCGVCHDACPEDAVRHDGERVPEEVRSNLSYARNLLAHDYYLGDRARQEQLIERLERHFIKDRKVAEATLEKLRSLMEEGG
ncbi:MAG: ferredoxin [Candidatus Aegiribacteria sp. MLS_C]|nr:MAG: ferredoxin [Candidatus Aegiribacteria sp. MLS_C]